MDVVVENLTKSFENQKAVDSISFKAKRGEILGFLGPNGAGKTTTMKIMAGLLTPDFGNITFGDYSIWKQAGKIKSIIGYLPERNPLYDEMNVIDFLFFISKLHNIPKYKITSRVLDMIRLCGLDNDKHKQIGELSKGYRQRVGIAQALIHDPEVVILDEPTTGLDPNQIFGIRKIIKEIGEEKTVILSSHILSEIETTCDQVMIMSNGKIVANGTTSELRRKSDAEYCLKIGIKGGATTNIHEALNDLPGVLHIEIIHKQNFELQCKPDVEIEKSIFNLCQENNWYISELTPVQTRLEDIFRKVTSVFCLPLVVCWFSGKNIFSSGQASLSNLFNVFYWTLFFLIPALTMKSISEERKDGTFELLFSKPIKTWQLIMGKFFAILLQVVICLALTLPYYITIASLGNVDHAVGFCGYLGLILVCGCYISIGMFASSLTPNTIVAFFITFAIEIGFVVLFEFIAELWGSGFMAALFTYLSIGEHFDAIPRGVIDTKDLIYFISVIIIFLALARHYICKNRF